MTSTDARLDAIEARLAALEQAPEPPGTTQPEGAFWALDGLRPHATGSGAVVWAGTYESPAGPLEWQYAVPTDTLVDADDAAHHVMAERLAAVGHPVRVAILGAVLRGHDRVSDLGEVLELGTSGQVYHHVKALTAAGWLRSAGRGRVAVPPERVIGLLVILGVVS